MNEKLSGLPEENPSTDRSTVEQICQEFLQAWQEGSAPPLEQFLSRTGERQRQRLLRALLVIEVRSRCRIGDVPKRRDYVARFPDDADLIKEAFQLIPQRPSAGPESKPQSESLANPDVETRTLKESSKKTRAQTNSKGNAPSNPPASKSAAAPKPVSEARPHPPSAPNDALSRALADTTPEETRPISLPSPFSKSGAHPVRPKPKSKTGWKPESWRALEFTIPVAVLIVVAVILYFNVGLQPGFESRATQGNQEVADAPVPKLDTPAPSAVPVDARGEYLAFTQKFGEALVAEDYDTAYAMMSNQFRDATSWEAFTEIHKKARTQFGKPLKCEAGAGTIGRGALNYDTFGKFSEVPAEIRRAWMHAGLALEIAGEKTVRCCNCWILIVEEDGTSRAGRFEYRWCD